MAGHDLRSDRYLPSKLNKTFLLGPFQHSTHTWTYVPLVRIPVSFQFGDSLDWSNMAENCYTRASPEYDDEGGGTTWNFGEGSSLIT